MNALLSAPLVAIPLQDASLDIWRTKYQLKAKDGTVIDEEVDDTFKRVARALVAVEDKRDQQHWYQRFVWALRNGAIPAGRIMSNAGAEEHKPSTSTINCTVSTTIEDSMHGILTGVYEAGITLAAGCGIGYEFSTLRPRGAFVAGVGAYTSGAISFMNIYDSMCFTVASAGGRRGAQMGTLMVSHPDVREFIKAKREDGRFRQFNLSLLITEEFMQAVNDGSDFPTYFPLNRKEPSENVECIWREWPHVSENMIVNEHGLVKCRVYSRINARELWATIMKSTYDYAEPGFLLIDEINKYNNNWFCENIRATNPCGEQPLPPYGACLLGSVNLTSFVSNPFSGDAAFDWATFRDVVAVFTRMLDNVVEINGLPLAKQQDEIFLKRRHGMGFMGLGSALAMLRIKYGSDEAVAFTEEVAKMMALIGLQVGIDLAIEKGPAPIMEVEFLVTPKMLRQRPQMLEDGYMVGHKVKGKVLLARYSNYMKRLAEVAPELVKQAEGTGLRFTHHTSIAPTGTISLSLGNNISNGIEPSFAHEYTRNVIREGKKTKDQMTVYSYEWLLHQMLRPAEPMPSYFCDTSNITPAQHVNMQAAAQKWVDSSISKTINVPADCPYSEFEDVYAYAYSKGLKGCTTFRPNPAAFQGVLVKDDDLANTTYVFKMEDGRELEFKGNDQVEYEGDVSSAANLFDALKEGYHGKF